MFDGLYDECSKNVKVGRNDEEYKDQHCWHLERTETFNNDRWKRYVCCYCGQRFEEHHKLRQDPSHGKHSPTKVFMLVDRKALSD